MPERAKYSATVAAPHTVQGDLNARRATPCGALSSPHGLIACADQVARQPAHLDRNARGDLNARTLKRFARRFPSPAQASSALEAEMAAV